MAKVRRDAATGKLCRNAATGKLSRCDCCTIPCGEQCFTLTVASVGLRFKDSGGTTLPYIDLSYKGSNYRATVVTSSLAGAYKTNPYTVVTGAVKWEPSFCAGDYLANVIKLEEWTGMGTFTGNVLWLHAYAYTFSVCGSSAYTAYLIVGEICDRRFSFIGNSVGVSDVTDCDDLYSRTPTFSTLTVSGGGGAPWTNITPGSLEMSAGSLAFSSGGTCSECDCEGNPYP